MSKAVMRIQAHFLVAMLIICGGCATPRESPLSGAWQDRDYVAINKYLGIRAAATTQRDHADFQLIQCVINDGDPNQINLIYALHDMAEIAFSYSAEETQPYDLRDSRIKAYEEAVCSILSDEKDRGRSRCLIFLWANQHYVTKKIVDAVLSLTKESTDVAVKRRNLTFLSAFFGFQHESFFFSDDEHAEGIRAFPFEQVRAYWSENHEKVMDHRANLSNYARMGSYRDRLYPFEKTSPLPTYSPPKDMGLKAESFPIE